MIEIFAKEFHSCDIVFRQKVKKKKISFFVHTLEDERIKMIETNLYTSV